MPVYIARRLVVSFFILLAATALVFWLVSISGDPLEDLYADPSPDRQTRIEERVRRLHLDEPLPQRYLRWLAGVSGCVLPGRPCDLGTNRSGQDVGVLLGQAAGTTLRLVLAATLLAILLGVGVGILSALRQYSGFDYGITFTAFLFFSLPLFWVAVLLKQYLAIDFNNWWAQPRISPVVMVGLGGLAGLVVPAVLGGDRRRRLWAGIGAAAVTVLVLAYLSAVEWFAAPALGPVLVPLLSVACAVGLTWLLAGLRDRAVLRSALVTVVVANLAGFALAPVLVDPTWALIGLLAVLTVVVGSAIGVLTGGLDRALAARVSVLSGLATGGWIFLDHVLSAVHGYGRLVSGRLVATIGSGTPNFTGDFWERFLDVAAHLALPTLAIMLISFAGYSRFTRATMLEVLTQDYVRTARAKGLPERTVVLRHAFRNALIPLTTLVALDFGGVIGGAVITEEVFGWHGMGSLFVTGLMQRDPNPVMGFFVLTAVSLVVFNLLADVAYAYLDPRIRMS
jgi:peptide/nickel transport system permease protein